MHVFVYASVCKFQRRNSVKGGKNVKPKKKIQFFLNKGKTVISIGNRKFSRSRMTKQTSPLNLSHEI